jgi:hypothetical protein
MHRRQDDGSAVVVVTRERRSVVGIDTGPYDRSLMTDHIDTTHGLFHPLAIADIETPQMIRRGGGGAMGRVEEQINADHLVVPC